MKIKAVRENQNYTEQDYLTFGKEYEVLKDHGSALIIKDDDGDPIFIRLTGSAHGFDFEVVQEEPEGLCLDPMPVVETDDDLECDRIEDNLNWLEGLTNGSPDQPTDNVNNPSHYGNGQIECIDYLEDFMTTEEFIGYLRGNIGKYLHRWRYKNGLEDLHKAEWYLKKLIEVYND